MSGVTRPEPRDDGAVFTCRNVSGVLLLLIGLLVITTGLVLVGYSKDEVLGGVWKGGFGALFFLPGVVLLPIGCALLVVPVGLWKGRRWALGAAAGLALVWLIFMTLLLLTDW